MHGIEIVVLIQGKSIYKYILIVDHEAKLTKIFMGSFIVCVYVPMIGNTRVIDILGGAYHSTASQVA